MVLVLVLVFLAIIAMEVPSLVKKQMWRELVAFSLLLLIGMVFSFGQALGYQMPNPNKGIEFIITSAGEIFK
ncbi:MAG: hypothetical protein M0Z31_07210 [Clostridia bacterium]|nr:hypothetical protein [Clostridia bacterium]